MKLLLPLLSSLCLSIVLPLAAHAQPAPGNPGIIPTPKNPWLEKHENFRRDLKSRNPSILFIGDSITEGWGSKGRGLDVWEANYAPLNAYNIGIGGDRTENVLWRLQNGGLDGIHPRLVVLLIGINNNGRGDSAAQIAEGVGAVLGEIRKQLPESKVLLLGIFPINPEANSPARTKVKDVNHTLATFADDRKVFFLDIGSTFLQPDGTISKDIMTDFVHLSPKGYQMWADAMKETFDKLATPSTQP